MKQGKYRDFTIPEDGKKRMIIAPDFKCRVIEYINKDKNRNTQVKKRGCRENCL